jgi:hypothetical protein
MSVINNYYTININQPVINVNNPTFTTNNNQNQRITIRVPRHHTQPEVPQEEEVEGEGTEYDVIHRPQLDAGLELLRLYDEDHEHRRWNMLIAQMQSGKTGTYLFVACEALRLQFEKSDHILATIETVVVFSGNTETELKNQVKADFKKFVNGAYKRYCMETHNYTESSYNELLIDKLNNIARFRIIWGAELNTNDVPRRKALYIWDESHAAQDNNMRPSKLLRRLGMVDGSGNHDVMSANNLFMLSVSATPFSEFSDVVHEYQMKNRVNLAAGEQYYGLEKIMAPRHDRPYGRIVPYDDWKDGLRQACVRHAAHRTPKYAIVRALHEKNASAEAIARNNGWAVKYYDTSRKGIRSLDELKTAPARNTVVIIKGMCRMGKVVPKKHIAFVMEASSSSLRSTSKYVSNTDTILQGLLGRMMGYNANNRTEIYLPNKIVDTDEFPRYVDFANTGARMPTRAANVNAPRAYDNSALNPIIPIRVRIEQHRGIDNTQNEINVEHLKASVIDAVLNGRMENFNAPDQTAELTAIMGSFDVSQIELRNTTHRTYEGVADKLYNIISAKNPGTLGGSCGIRADGTEIKLYYFPTAIPEKNIRAGDVFIDARTEAGDHPVLLADNNEANKTAAVPKTTKREIFWQRPAL